MNNARPIQSEIIRVIPQHQPHYEYFKPPVTSAMLKELSSVNLYEARSFKITDLYRGYPPTPSPPLDYLRGLQFLKSVWKRENAYFIKHSNKLEPQINIRNSPAVRINRLMDPGHSPESTGT